MTRSKAVYAAHDYYHSGRFAADLARRVGFKTDRVHSGDLEYRAYLEDELGPHLQRLGFSCDIASSEHGRNWFMIASRLEDAQKPTVLLYGHGDVVAGMDRSWSEGLSPWSFTIVGDRLYGRGSADNKGQHTINLAALETVWRERGGQLGFNIKVLMEMGEEIGSPGLRAFCRTRRDDLAADVLIASDGPRLSAERPTVFLGARGTMQIRLAVDLRPGGHHSGNWGGLIGNPATILVNAISSMVDGRGRILIEGLRPQPIPEKVRQVLAEVALAPGPDEPSIDADWGEPGLSPAERVFGWNALETIALGAGDVVNPVNAIPGRADAVCQLRFVVGTNTQGAGKALRKHLDAHGFEQVSVELKVGASATRLDVDEPWVTWAIGSIAQTTAKAPALLPNFGGSLPNDIFVEELNLKTLWIPHSYPGCNQHAPDEHMLAPIAEEALGLMAGLFWDLGEPDTLALVAK